MFVSRLPAAWGESDVRRYFEAHGELTQVSIFTLEGRGSLGCAYITFAKRSEAEETIRTLSKSVHGTYTFRVAREHCSCDGRTARLSAWDSSPLSEHPNTSNTSVPRAGRTTGARRATLRPGLGPVTPTPSRRLPQCPHPALYYPFRTSLEPISSSSTCPMSGPTKTWSRISALSAISSVHGS